MFRHIIWLCHLGRLKEKKLYYMCLMNINISLIFFYKHVCDARALYCIKILVTIVSMYSACACRTRMFLGTTFFMEYICYDWRYVLILWTSSSWVIVFATIKLDDWRWSGLIIKFNSGKSSSTHCNYINKSIIWKPYVYELLSIYGLVVFAAFVMSKL